MPTHRQMPRFVATGLVVLLMAACAPLRVVGPDYQPQPPATAPAWQATLPHGGSQAALAQWWRQLDDPLLPVLIERAQAQSPSLVQAQTRISQARSVLIAAGAASQPTLDLGASTNRAAVTFGGPLFLRTLTQVQAQSSWEIDLFGGLRREREAAAARLDARAADWHEARVSVAAETANLYAQLRFCELQVALYDEDLKSRRESARLTDLAAGAGFQAPANAALARASVADASARLSGQQADCDLVIKSLVALTAADETQLRGELAAARARPPKPRAFEVLQVPAQLLNQRPDLASAERELAAASADIGVAEAARYPKLSLSGSVAPSYVVTAGQSISAVTWSIGPSLSLPLFDGGRRLANRDAAVAAYEAAEANYRARARSAVREVEEALVRLTSANRRQPDVESAADGYRANLAAAQSRYTAGVGSLLELEESRRLSLAAQANVIAIDRDRLSAWISLYRAIGGGWTPESKVSP